MSCCGGDPLVALQTALELRVPFVGLSPARIEPRSRAHLAELAWRAQVPVVLWAGALPGLPGVLAEALVRKLPAIGRLRIASTGSYLETETARREDRAATPPGDVSRLESLRRLVPSCGSFAEPIGARPVVPSWSPELSTASPRATASGRSTTSSRRAARSAARSRRLVAREPGAGFALAATASCDPDPAAPPTAGIELFAHNVLIPAAALASAITGAILDGAVPAGALHAARGASPGAGAGRAREARRADQFLSFALSRSRSGRMPLVRMPRRSSSFAIEPSL